MSKNFNEKNMDTVIKNHLGESGALGDYSIEPSDDFVKNVMMEIKKVQRGRVMAFRFLVVVLSLLPFSIRIAWDYLRGDYISLSKMPFGAYMASAYHIFMSTGTIYLFLVAGSAVAVYLLFKNKGAIQALNRI